MGRTIFGKRFLGRFTTTFTTTLTAALVCVLLVVGVVTGDEPKPKWTIIGPGGGGSMFFPTVSPHDPSLMLIACDMTGAYITRDAGKSWREFNLRNRVDSFAFDPSDPRVIYAGSSGVFRSDDRGTSWRLVLPEPSKGVTERMVGDHADHAFLSPGWPGGKVQAIRVDPTNRSRVLAAVRADRIYVFRSEDGAKTWTRLMDAPDANAYTLYLDPASPEGDRLLYLLTSSSVYRTRLGQPKPERVSLPATITSVKHAAAGFDSASRRSVLYLIGPPAWREDRFHTGVWRSADGGQSWDELSGGLEKDLAGPEAKVLPEFNFIGISERHAATAYLGVVRHPEKASGKVEDFFGILKTVDSGDTWGWVVRSSERPNPPNRTDGWIGRNYDAGWGGSPHGIGVSPTKPDVAVATDYGTAYYTMDGGKKWVQVYCNDHPDGSVSTRGLDVTTAYGVHFDPFDRDHLAISYTDIGFFHSFNGGKTWTQALKGVPREWINTCYWLVFDPEVKGKAWSVWGNAHDLPRPKMFRGNFDRYLGGVCRTEDGCRTWEKTSRGMPDNTVSTHIVLDPRSPRDARVLYVAGFGKGVFKSTDGGNSWKEASSGLGDNRNAWRLVLLPDGTLYLMVARGLRNGAVVDGALYRSADGAQTWQLVPMPAGANAPNDLVFDPSNPAKMYLACWPYPIAGVERHGGLYVTEDGGASWRQTFNESAHVYGVTLDPSHAGRLFINTFDSAAYRSDDSGRNWRRLEGYNFKWGHHAILDPHNPSMLYLTTFGSSVWYGPVDGVPGAFEDILSVGGWLRSQPAEENTGIIVSTPSLEIRFDDRMHRRIAWQGQGIASILVDSPSVQDSVVIEGIDVQDFEIDRKRASQRRTVHPEFGPSTEAIVVGALPRPGLGLRMEREVRLILPDRFPGTAIWQNTYRNVGSDPIHLDEVNSARLLLDRGQAEPDQHSYAFASFQGGAYSWGRDYSLIWLEPGKEQSNFQGVGNVKGPEGVGGGMPFVDVWSPGMGVAIAHVEKKPQWLSLPVRVRPDEKVEIAVREQPQKQLGQREWLKTGESFDSVWTAIIFHHGDFHDPLRIYGQLLRARGIAIPERSPDMAYEPYWKTWGLERNFTVERLLAYLPELASMGIRIANLDDGWYDKIGDWEVNRATGKFPNGDADMSAFVKRVHDAGFKTSLWWYPLGVSPDSRLAREHPELLVQDAEGRYPKDIDDLYQLCPAYEPALAQVEKVLRRAIERYGFDGVYTDFQGLSGVPPCFNAHHGHTSPLDSFQSLPRLFETIQKGMAKIRPGLLHEVCICAMPHSAYNMPFYELANASDPVNTAQTRRRIKVEKAIRGPFFAVGDCYQVPIDEWRGASVPQSFESAIGTGAQLTSYYTDLDPGQKNLWTRWFRQYRELGLARAEYLNLYDIAFDRPEGHAVKKDDTFYYGFYSELWSMRRPIRLRGLDPGRTYEVYDYANDRPLGKVKGSDPRLNVGFRDSLLIRVKPVE